MAAMAAIGTDDSSDCYPRSECAISAHRSIIPALQSFVAPSSRILRELVVPRRAQKRVHAFRSGNMLYWLSRRASHQNSLSESNLHVGQ
jgi:hypothetical protein